MKKKLKKIILYLSKCIGLFAISKYITRKGLRILCYHSFAMGDYEIKWHPGLFIRPETFRRRLEFLAKEKYLVLGLEQALDLMIGKKLSNCSTVITIDDGWYAIKACAHEILQEASYPYTVYMTSYYSMKGTPIFNLIVDFMFWKTKKDHLDMANLGVSMSDVVRFSDPNSLKKAIQKIKEYGHSKLDISGRFELAKRLSEKLEIDYEEIEKSKILNLLTNDDIKKLSDDGVDFQLHSHRHRWPLDKQAALRELSENQTFLESLTGRTPLHFCYPSGIWSYEQLPYLFEAGIKSATTGQSGINYYQKTPLYLLRRIVDGERKSQIEFEAEITGYLYLLKKIQNLLFLRKER